MSDPWFNPTLFGAFYGGIGGSLVGVLGGVIGSLAGTWAPRGKGRRLVLGLMAGTAGLGVLQIVFGLIAMACGQPTAIWSAPLYLGALTTLIFGALIPEVRKRYAQAEERRMAAETIRLGA